MDHFNITVSKDGALVATRRGLQVSKQKHRGLSFVNSYAPPPDPVPRPPAVPGTPAPASVDLGQPLVQRWRFVSKDPEPRKAAAAKTAGSERSGQTRKAPRRAGPKAPPAANRLPTPNSTSSDSDRDDAGVPGQFNFNLVPEPGAAPPSRSLPDWTTVPLPLSERDQRLFFNFYALVPRKMYPFEDLFTYNPARSPEFFRMIIGDAAAIHCVLMCNSMFRSVLSGKMDSEELAYLIAKICAIINRQLGEMPKTIPNITLECITTLALMGVSRSASPLRPNTR